MSSAYLRSTRDALRAIPGAHLEDLAGGCYGVGVRLEGGCTLVIARNPDLGAHPAYATWAAQICDPDGEHLWPDTHDMWHDLGHVRPRDYASMLPAALEAYVTDTRVTAGTCGERHRPHSCSGEIWCPES